MNKYYNEFVMVICSAIVIASIIIDDYKGILTAMFLIVYSIFMEVIKIRKEMEKTTNIHIEPVKICINSTTKEELEKSFKKMHENGDDDLIEM